MSIFSKFALSLTFGLSFLPLATLSHAALSESTQKTLQQYLAQERAIAGLTTKTLKVGDMVWSYNEGGVKNKSTIILIHGLAGSKDDWNRVAKFLTPSYHVIIPDLPTNGETRTPRDFDFSIPNVTSELRNFIETLNIDENLNIAGHSLGGSIATVYASQYPFDTQSLFLLNSAGIYKLANTPYTKNPQTLKNLIVTKAGDLDDVSRQLMENPPQIPYQYKSAQEKLLISKSATTLKAVDQVVMLSRLYTPESFARLTRTIEAPTLILWGKQDRIFNFEVAKELYGLLKRPETPIILNNVGHMPILEAEKQVAQYYLPFLAKTQILKNPLADKLIPLN
ncbi:lipase [Acinetobacter sp. NCu2D-2]|nr:lipase [Acinetobacter sp. NCu2D-2]